MSKIIFFAGESLIGKGRVFQGPTPSLPSNQDDKMSSATVIKGEWELFSERGFSGERWVISAESGPTSDGVFLDLNGFGDNEISSFRPLLQAPIKHGNNGAEFQSLFQNSDGTPALTPAKFPEDALMALGASNGPMLDDNLPDGDNTEIPAGYTYLGQFIDHDITFDPTSKLTGNNVTSTINNFRTPCLELDNVYGTGPDDEPYLYDSQDKKKLLIGNAENSNGDVQRNRQGTAIIGDPRNDENVIVSSIQFLMIRFHNKMVDKLRADQIPENEVFKKAQQLVRWHYQWVVLNDYLPRICGQDKVNDALAERHFYTPSTAAEIYMPLEFSVAAYRFGHGQVRETYRHNDVFQNATLGELFFNFPTSTLPRAVSQIWEIDWSNFFATDENTEPQKNRKINSKINRHLLNLPFIGPGDISSLAQRNLLRGVSMGLASGQAVAERMDIEPLSAREMNANDPGNTLAQLGLDTSTPLWFYCLKEAEVQSDGQQLGQVGGTIVAETLVGILQVDEHSFLTANPDWTPTLANADGLFEMADLIQFTTS
ncbi:hypothetical protein A9Q99_20995 [Gammaproteobacteria bacterium 45_16_T64]|nr:hypothetical protein A9Q99_20995 [Gammaproteobacteria bacterium 45_16_T64]